MRCKGFMLVATAYCGPAMPHFCLARSSEASTNGRVTWESVVGFDFSAAPDRTRHISTPRGHTPAVKSVPALPPVDMETYVPAAITVVRRSVGWPGILLQER